MSLGTVHGQGSLVYSGRSDGLDRHQTDDCHAFKLPKHVKNKNKNLGIDCHQSDDHHVNLNHRQNAEKYKKNNIFYCFILYF